MLIRSLTKPGLLLAAVLAVYPLVCVSLLLTFFLSVRQPGYLPLREALRLCAPASRRVCLYRRASKKAMHPHMCRMAQVEVCVKGWFYKSLRLVC